MSEWRAGVALDGFERAVTQSMVDSYAQASGDTNPIHIDPEFAATTSFGRTIAHGMLSMALLAELATRNFGPAWTSGASMRVKFKAPIIPGETVMARGTVKQVDTTARTVLLNMELVKPDGTVAVLGESTVAF